MLAGVVRVVDSITSKAYREYDENRDRYLTTSFHISNFPGDNPIACGREAVYRLLNLPEREPTTRFLNSVADAGKDIENQLVKRWSASGRLLSADITDELQTSLIDREHWLSGKLDAAILPYKWRRPHIVEVKTKADDKIEEMKRLERKWDLKHRLQCMTYIGLAHEMHPWKYAVVCKDTWKLGDYAYDANYIDPLSISHLIPWCTYHDSASCAQEIKLDPCIDGTIYYVSRDNPSNTFEFNFSYDPDFLSKGRATLKEWKESFLNEQLPTRPRHPSGKLVGWSESPCNYCRFKKGLCRVDWDNKVTDLRESNLIRWAKQIDQNYDYEKIREQVLDRWK